MNTSKWQQAPIRKTLQLTCLGFSAGIPILLIFSTLSLWLNEAGVSKSAVTYFSLAALGYSFKFIWAPIVDSLPLPILSKGLGRRRGWLLLSQLAVIGAIIWMASVNPLGGLTVMAFASVALGFSSATQDIVIDTYRIECAKTDEQAILASGYFTGYRLGMIVAGAGGLYLAQLFGSTVESYSYFAWQKTYWIMALIMGVGILTTLLIPEPEHENYAKAYPYHMKTYLSFFAIFLLSITALVCTFIFFPEVEFQEGPLNQILRFLFASIKMFSALIAAISIGLMGVRLGFVDNQMVAENYFSPIKDFFSRYGRLAIWVLLLIGFYRVSDIVMGVMANLFYQDLGYSKSEIAGVTKVFGVVMVITGGFFGGFLALRISVMWVLLLGAVLSAATNIVFIWLSMTAPTMQALTLVIAIDNLSAGLAVTAFLAWLASLTSISFTATQYAIFSSMMTLFPKLLGSYAGTIVEQFGYSYFFLFTAVLGIPIVFLILFLQKRLEE